MTANRHGWLYEIQRGFNKGEVNLSKLDYCMVLETWNEQSNEPESLPEHCAGILRLLTEIEPSPEPDIEIEEELEAGE